VKKYIPKLVEGTDDQYKIYNEDRSVMFCGDQLDEEFVKVEDVLSAIESAEGDIDYLEFKLKAKP